MDKVLRASVGVGLAEAERWDVARVFRATEVGSRVPADRMLPALVATLQDLGIDLHSQENIHLDVEERPHKTPRAFCAPIEVPGKVMLVIQPMGGPDDWGALFHEAGHAEHFANTRAELTVEERRLGDSAVTEGWAMLMQYLTNDRRGSRAASTSRARPSSRPKARRTSSSSSGATARSSCTSSSSTSRTTRPRCAHATSNCSATR